MKSVKSVHLARRRMSPGLVPDRHRAGISTGTRGDVTVLTAHGEFDAANGDCLVDAIRRVAGPRSPVILDLSGVSFLAVSAFRAVSDLNRTHRDAGALLVAVPSDAVRRLTRLIPDHGLRLEGCLGEAVEQIARITLVSSRGGGAVG